MDQDAPESAAGASRSLSSLLDTPEEAARLGAASLVRLACADQSSRWRNGDRVLAEEYLERYPALRENADAAVDLIYSELLLREELGDAFEPVEYLRRFPRFHDALERQLALHEVLRSTSQDEAAGAITPAGQPGSASSSPESADQTPLESDPKALTKKSAQQGPDVLDSGCKSLSIVAPDRARVTRDSIDSTSVPGYEIIAELGRGGMGVVYKARHIRLNRLVALKVLLAGAHASGEQLKRLQSEAEALARLQHANVVQIFEVGEHHGQPFLALEFVEGGSLAKRLDADVLTSLEAASLVETLARAVHVAHLHQIVHRDLKPGNILLSADGTPKVTDFGLAKLLDGDGTQTESGAILGTINYMAPEQAEGRTHDIGPLADVYALGATLYHMLCGKPPYESANRMETLVKVRSQDLVPPSQYRKGISRTLEAICLKCLEKDRERRYGSAEELADDLERWLRGEPVVARPETRLKRLKRWARRHRNRCALVSACLVFVLAALALWWYHDPDRELRQIETRLANGDTVTLIGETGKPRWFKWRLGAGSGKDSVGDDGTFRISSWEPALLELVGDPQSERYTFSAEVRHLRSHEYSEVGIYFEHHMCGKPQDIHLYSRLFFNDLRDDKHTWAELDRTNLAGDASIRPRAPEGNRVSLYTTFRQDKTSSGGLPARLLCMERLFVPAKTSPGPWRRLTVNVSPFSVCCS